VCLLEILLEFVQLSSKLSSLLLQLKVPLLCVLRVLNVVFCNEFMIVISLSGFALVVAANTNVLCCLLLVAVVSINFCRYLILFIQPIIRVVIV